VSFVSLLLTITSMTAIAQPAPPSAPTQSHANNSSFADFIAEASRRFGIPAAWIHAVMQAESDGDARAVSPKGAMGLMQIMPRTWAELRVRYHLGTDPFDGHDNILAGVAFLRELYDRYGAPGFLAAYQAGPRRYEDHLTTGRVLPADTRAYVAALAPVIEGVSDDRQVAVADPLAWTRSPLFAVQNNNAAAAASDANPSPPRRTEADHAAVEASSLAPPSDGLFVPVAGHRP
jgi:soluble lytic murein transglycosylase-like protein